MRITFLYGLLLLVAALAPAQAEPVVIRTAQGVALRAELHAPAGGPRGAAIVVMHGCGGPSKRDRQWIDLLVQGGHMVLAPDSYASRGLGPQCRVPRDTRSITAVRDRRNDALAAAAWLAARPGTPAGGVVIMGWSDGGTAALAAARPAAEVPPGLLRGFVVFYPVCAQVATEPGWRPAAPMLALAGEADRRAPVAPCRALFDRQPAVKLLPFAGAGHDFDAPPVRARNRPGRDGGADAAAREAALAQVPAWIDALPPAR